MVCVDVEFAGHKGRSCARGGAVAAQAASIRAASIAQLKGLVPVGAEARFADIDRAARVRIATFAEAAFEELLVSAPDADSYIAFIAADIVREIDACTQALTSRPDSVYKGKPKADMRALALQCAALCYPTMRSVAGAFSKLISEATGDESRALAEVKSLVQDERTHQLHKDEGFQNYIEDVRLSMFELRERVGVLATLTQPMAAIDPKRLSASGFGMAADDDFRVLPNMDILSTFEFDPDLNIYKVTNIPSATTRAISDSWARAGDVAQTPSAVQGTPVELVFLMMVAFQFWASEAACLHVCLNRLNLATAHVSRALATLNGTQTAKLDQEIVRLEVLSDVDGVCARRASAKECEVTDGSSLFVRYLGLSAAIFSAAWAVRKLISR